MGSLIVGDIMLLFFSIYIGIFFIKFHSNYPDMSVGFHVWEVCYSKETWSYGNKYAGKIAIILGIIFFALIYPLAIYFQFKMLYLTILLIVFLIIYLVLLFLIVKLHMRKKFKLK